MSKTFKEWWIVETRDNKESEFYQVAGEFESWRVANYFANKCLLGARKRHAQIVYCSMRRDVPTKPDPTALDETK